MAGISNIISSTERRLVAQWNKSTALAALSTYRISTEKRVNYPWDDPQAFVALSGLQSRLNTVTDTLSNVTAASSLVTQTQSTMTQLRTQLSTIRTELLKDESGVLTPDQRAASQAVIDQAVAQINTLTGTTINGRRTLDGSADFQTTGRNFAQMRDLRVYSTSTAGPLVAARQAELTYTGTSRYVTSAATFRVTGVKGTASFSVTTSDTLEAVARAVNAQTANTGVTATVSDNTMKFNSVGASAGSTARITVDSGSFVVAGGDATGTAYGVTQVMGTVPSISGRVTQAATQASLLYTGSGGATTAAATFALSGKTGSSSITVTNGEALTSVASKINMVSHKTGVTASVSGNELRMNSVDYGTSATVGVAVSSGTFTATGGNGDGTANGANATAEINGRTYAGSTLAQQATLRHREKTTTIANNAQIKITGGLGSTTLTIDTVGHTNDTLATLASSINAATGTTGVWATVDQNDLVLKSTTRGSSAAISVETLSGTFDAVSGYTAAAKATITHSDPSELITSNASFTLTGNLGSAGFSVSVGDSLSDVADDINTQTGTTGVAAYANGGYLYIQSTGTGPTAFANINVTSGTFNYSGTNGGGTAFGTNATSAATGSNAVTSAYNIQGNTFDINESGFHYAASFANGFSGNFDTVQVIGPAMQFDLATTPGSPSQLPIAAMSSNYLGGVSGNLSQIVSGGLYSGLNSNTSRAIRIVDEAVARYNTVRGVVDGYYTATVTTSSAQLTQMQTDLNKAITQTDGFNLEEEEQLVAHYNELASNSLSGLYVINQQRLLMVDMIKKIAGLSS